MQDKKKIKQFLPLHLMGRAFSIYQQLSEEVKFNVEQIKHFMSMAFATDSFVAYEQQKFEIS